MRTLQTDRRADGNHHVCSFPPSAGVCVAVRGASDRCSRWPVKDCSLEETDSDVACSKGVRSGDPRQLSVGLCAHIERQPRRGIGGRAHHGFALGGLCYRWLFLSAPTWQRRLFLYIEQRGKFLRAHAVGPTLSTALRRRSSCARHRESSAACAWKVFT